MEMERSQFTFYKSFAQAISRIRKKADRADAYDAICNYALYGIEPDLDSLPDSAAIAFELVKPNLDVSRRKANNGKAGGARKQTESKPKANAKQEETVSKPEAMEKTKQEHQASKKEKEKEKEKEYECTPPYPPSWGEGLRSVMDSWLAYKAEKKQGYKPQGLKSLVTQVDGYAAKYGENLVIAVIQRSMAANYQGIVWDWLQKSSGQAGWKPGKAQGADQKSAQDVQANDLDWLQNYMKNREERRDT